MWTKIKTILIKETHVKMSSTKCPQISSHHNALTHCGLVMPYGDINLDQICSGYGLLPDSTNPLLEPLFLAIFSDIQ